MKKLKSHNPAPFVGAGLRTEHYAHIETDFDTQLEWFEVISENHMTSKGRPWKILERIRRDFPISCHGVSLNLGSSQGLNYRYLKVLKAFIDAFRPFLVSDHLCWTGIENNNLHNLLPLPYNLDTLNLLSERIEAIQNYLQRPIALENLSAYFDYTQSTMTEWKFLNELTKKSGCSLLLDINNVYVNSQNYGFNPYQFLEAIDPNHVAEIHLAGFSTRGEFLFDTHSRPVHSEVWQLYRYFSGRAQRKIPTLLEWDEDIPSFGELEAEAMKCHEMWED